MAESIYIDHSLTKKEKYEDLLPQIQALIEGETDLIANLANVCAALKYGMDFFWVGFYLVKGQQLVLGPFQGTVACTRIDFDKGVCGACYQQKETIIVPDVEAFPGHIACSSLSRSEIVVPIVKDNQVIMVLDVDSTQLNDYDAIDKTYLEKIASIIEEKIIQF
ncbi:GAF domain-containing protein [Thermoflexibacter ruber]|uniref:GAF domain-containing protein n=1 Tax=Thermoflexibacter ruber TaxID=1003 RepID=A0A1I2AIJ1_9BACT|nr:GAF domain-containing protein [Thermoflexibacter ruber]SFE43712.1 GAF domain-containing protein [Thermoflexibacter ruber]